MEQELIEKILGTVLEYRAGYFWFECDGVGGGGTKSTAYEEMELTPEAFLSVYGVALEDLGVEPDTYLAVTINVDYSWHEDAIAAFLRSLGSRFLLLDGETILACAEGAFFRAEIVPDSWPTIPDPDFQLPLPSP